MGSLGFGGGGLGAGFSVGRSSLLLTASPSGPTRRRGRRRWQFWAQVPM
jgi:hypothetical protein